MTSRFSMGVAGRRQRDFDYSGVASSNVFRQALDDSDTDDDGARQGRVNYVALAEKDKRQDDVDDVIDAVEQSTDDKLEAYDEHFEEMQRRRKLVVQGNSGNKSVRYMDGLKAAADKRKREQTINYEKIAAKQMQREGKEFESKGRFLTEGYKNMLMLNKEFEEDDDAKEKYNENNSAANRSDMTNFFRKMYAQEMTFGGPRGPIETEGHKENIQIEFNAAASDSEDDNKTSEKGSKAMGVQQPGTDEVKSKERAEIKRERSRSQSKDRPRVKESKTVDQTEMEALKQKEPVLSREQKIELLKQRMMERKQNPTSILPE